MMKKPPALRINSNDKTIYKQRMIPVNLGASLGTKPTNRDAQHLLYRTPLLPNSFLPTGSSGRTQPLARLASRFSAS
jgi:hypothetical protein